MVECNHPESVSQDSQIVRCQLLRQARVAKGLTQCEVGKRLGVSQTWLSRIENGSAPMKPVLISRLAAELEIGSQGLALLFSESTEAAWRHWVWWSARPASEKLLLLALIDAEAGRASLEQLSVLTGLTRGTLQATLDALTRDGYARLSPEGHDQPPSVALVAPTQRGGAR